MTGRVTMVILLALVIASGNTAYAQMPSMKEAPKCQKLLDALQQEYQSYSAKLAAAKTDAEREKVKGNPQRDRSTRLWRRSPRPRHSPIVFRVGILLWKRCRRSGFCPHVERHQTSLPLSLWLQG